MPFFHSKAFLWAELVILMIGVPLLLWLVLPPRAILPTVWCMAILCHFISNHVHGLPKQHWWNQAAINRAEVVAVLKRFVLCALLLSIATVVLVPHLLFGFVREKPQIWLAVMVLYPLISVVAQEIIFRRYMFVRYQNLLTPTMLVLVSGLGFGFAHVVFGNWVAPLLCAIGGVMFSRTYARTGSLALVSLEHALYGNFLFTIGLGRYFYHGAAH